MENGKICPKCYGRECTKNGIVKNKQRYRCKRCKYNFTRSTCWKYSDEIRQLVGNIQMKLGKKLLNFILKGMVSEE